MAIEDKKRHERNVCLAAAHLRARRSGQTLNNLVWLEDQERQKKTVELRFEMGSSTVVLEHTRIESFSGQITDDHQFMALLGALESRLTGRLPTPGYYNLCVAPGAVKGAKEIKRIQDAIEAWVLAKAPTLELGSPRTAPKHFVKGRPAGVPFEVSLYRWKSAGRLEGRLLLMRSSPRDVESERERRVAMALAAKCPKLAEARQSGFASLLVLESNDLALANSAVIGSAVIAQLALRTDDAPDVIFLIETEIAPWAAWVLKDGQHLFPSVPDDGPHYIDPQTLLASGEP